MTITERAAGVSAATEPTAAPSDSLALARAYLTKLERAHAAKGRSGRFKPGRADDPVEALLADVDDDPKGSALRPDLVALGILTARAICAVPDMSRALLREQTVATVAVGASEHAAVVGNVLQQCSLPDGSFVGKDDKRRRYRLRGLSDEAEDEGALCIVRSGLDRTDRATEGNDVVSEAIVDGRSVIGVAPNPRRHLPRDLVRTAEYAIELPLLDASGLALAIGWITGHEGVAILTPDGAPDDAFARRLDVTDLNLAIRSSRTPDECLERLRRIVDVRMVEHTGPKLSELSGYGDAKVWGLGCAADLRALRAGDIDWSDFDHRGLLLAGPPGVGKSSFAKALAAEADVPLVVTSVAEWIGTEHLGYAIQSMSEKFREATKLAPAVLHIDELDSISSREHMRAKDENSYGSVLLNALLELLQGVEQREGVVILGATNHASHIDPAIKRAGRMDRTIDLGPPDAEALAATFDMYAPGVLSQNERGRLGLIAERHRATGADVEAWCKRAAGAARRSGKGATFEDIRFEIEGRTQDGSPEVMRRTAIHEAGHVVALAALRGWCPKRVVLDAAGGGYVEPDDESLVWDGPDDVHRHIAVMLAGTEAEHLVLGNRCLGYALGEGSDLRRATRLAVLAQSAFGDEEHAPIALGDLDYAHLRLSPSLQRSVERRLTAARDEARERLRDHLTTVELVSEMLLDRRVLDRADIKPALVKLLPPDAGPPDLLTERTGNSGEVRS